MKNLAGQYAIVTGAGKGIGAAIAKRFVEEEAAGVAILEWDLALAEKTAKELGAALKVVSFVRFEKGEGIEKREDNFAEEIAKLTGQK